MGGRGGGGDDLSFITHTHTHTRTYIHTHPHPHPHTFIKGLGRLYRKRRERRHQYRCTRARNSLIDLKKGRSMRSHFWCPFALQAGPIDLNEWRSRRSPFWRRLVSLLQEGTKNGYIYIYIYNRLVSLLQEGAPAPSICKKGVNCACMRSKTVHACV